MDASYISQLNTVKGR